MKTQKTYIYFSYIILKNMKTLYRINKERYFKNLDEVVNDINTEYVSCYNPLLVERIKLDWNKISIEELLNVRDTFDNLWYDEEDLKNLKDLISDWYDKIRFIEFTKEEIEEAKESEYFEYDTAYEDEREYVEIIEKFEE